MFVLGISVSSISASLSICDCVRGYQPINRINSIHNNYIIDKMWIDSFVITASMSLAPAAF